MLVLDPLTYLCRIVERNIDGSPRVLEVIYDTEMVHLDDGDAFVRMTATVALETLGDPS